MLPYVLVGLGSALGGIARFWIGPIAATWLGQVFLGTVFVNVTGSFLIGFIAALGPMPFAQQLFMIGVLGGYTTFSTFSLQTLELAREGRWGLAGANIVLSVTCSLAAVCLGHLSGTWTNR